jgi:hypothetical protein
MNLVDQLKDQLGPQLVGAAGQALGLPSDKVQAAVHAGIPALLASFLHVSSTPTGASALGAAAEQAAQSGAVPSIAGGAQSMAQEGIGLLGSLLGQGKVQALSNALGSFTGINPGHASSLIGMAAPMVLGFLGRQQAARGQGAQGLVSLLTEQKSAITAALPAGLSSLLGSTGLLDGVTGAAQAGREAVTGAARSAAGAASDAAARASEAANRASAAAGQAVTGSSWVRPAVGVLVAIVVLVALWQFFSGGRVQEASQQAANKAQEATTTATQQATGAAQQATGAAQQAAGAAQQAAGAAPEAAKSTATALVVGGTDVGKEVSGAFDHLGQVLGGITDADSAKAALPQIHEISGSVDKLKGLVGQLPDTGKTALADLIAKAMAAVQPLVDKAYALPGVGDVLKPELDPLLAAIGDLAKKPA